MTRPSRPRPPKPRVTTPPKPIEEREVQHDIREALGLEPDLVLWRNNVGVAEALNGGKVRYGLTPGSADLIGVGPQGRFFALEVKRPGERARKEQEQWLRLVRRMGGFAACVRSTDEARAALERAREGKCE